MNKKHGAWSKNEKIFLGLLAPILVLFFCFNTLPLIKGFYYGLTNFRGYGSYDFVGLRNFAEIFQDSRVGHSYLFTFKYALVMTIVVNLLSLILALGLNSKIRGKNALRGVYFVPTIGEVTGIDFLKTSLLGSTKWAWIAIVIVGAWQGIAMNTIIYISGLQTVPEEVYEACMLDGASGWKKFKSITLPLIMPFVTINLVLCMKNALMVFDQIMSLTKGGPSQSTESISYLIYNNGMSGGQFGFQSANAFVFFIVIVAISLFQMKFLGSKEEQL